MWVCSLLVAACLGAASTAQGAPSPSPSPSLVPPPPTPVAGTLSPFPTVLHTPGHPARRAPRIDAPEAILEDLATGQVLFRRRPNGPRPIASLTKIMTALVVIRSTDPDRRVPASQRAAGQTGSVLGLRVGERVSVRNLLYALLLQSSNDAAVALAEAVSGTEARFVRRMNRTARSLGLDHSRFHSASGLDDRGRSSPADLAALTRAAGALPLFRRIVGTEFHSIPAPGGPPRRVQNRNALLWLYPGATGVKTGFTAAAQNCLVATAERGGRGLVAIVLGDRPEPFDDAAALLNFGFAAFQPVTLVSRGQPVGAVTVQGRPVDAVASAQMVRLVERTTPAPSLHLVPAPGLRLPVRAGQVVGTVVLDVGGRRVGSVPAVAATGVDALGRANGAPVGRQPLDDVLELLGLLVRSVFGSFL